MLILQASKYDFRSGPGSNPQKFWNYVFLGSALARTAISAFLNIKVCN